MIVGAMRTPRYEVRSVTGYNALGSGVAGDCERLNRENDEWLRA